MSSGDRSADRDRADAGAVLLALILAIVVGGVLAGLASVAVVNLTARSTTPATAPVVTYDSK
ncbi:MAG TPA: hypothetical protein VMI11_14900 [Actinomycetes bacterium]|nr:hypothetical protein [Actinomycetes bacterium]